MEVNRSRNWRLEKRKNKRKKLIVIVRNIILLILVFVLIYMIYGMYKEVKVRNFASNENIGVLSKKDKNIEDNLTNTNMNRSFIEMPEVLVVEKYKGYDVDSRLEIPKIKLSTNVLKEYTTEGLDVCASKYYGPNANEIGNYCIAGHNYNKENMFNHLIDLSLGDSIYLTDNENGVVEYTVYDIYKVKPQNTEPLSQETQGERELTLITCVNYSKNRLVVKAIEKI